MICYDREYAHIATAHSSETEDFNRRKILRSLTSVVEELAGLLTIGKYLCESESIKVLPPLIFREKLYQPRLIVLTF